MNAIKLPITVTVVLSHESRRTWIVASLGSNSSVHFTNLSKVALQKIVFEFSVLNTSISSDNFFFIIMIPGVRYILFTADIPFVLAKHPAKQWSNLRKIS